VPIIIPPFSQYQAPLFPLRGLWNAPPVEGDMFVAAEIDWGTYPPGQAVQLALSGNSPVAMSQIVALSVDNSRCGTDIRFVFPDSGFTLVVPAHDSGVYPVFSNALSFYVVALAAGGSDVTSLNVHNSMPPSIAVQRSTLQNSVAVLGIPTSNGQTTLVAPPRSGTLNGLSIVIDYNVTAAGERMQLTVYDGTAAILWNTTFASAIDTVGVQPYSIGGLAARFVNGLFFGVAASTVLATDISVNAYYSSP
jgi:hypothetical protein